MLEFRNAFFSFFLFTGFIFNSWIAECADKIQDNSFLIEEAYNQEDGVIQHIQTFQYLKDRKTWGYTFTEEWPIPKQAHQLSFTIPVNHLGIYNRKIRESSFLNSLLNRESKEVALPYPFNY